MTLLRTHKNLPKTLGDHSENVDVLTCWFLIFDLFEMLGILNFVFLGNFGLFSEAVKSRKFSKISILEDLDLLTMGDE